MSEQYEVFAIKYAHHARKASENFIGGDAHDGPMPLDFFIWVARNERRTVVIDTGFTPETAARRQRHLLRTPAEGLRLLGVDAATVPDVVITHLHYDHVGGFGYTPNARFHLQEREMHFATGRCMTHGHMRIAIDVEDVTGMIRELYKGKVCFHDGAEEIAPGLSVHHVGGHTAGLQVVRVQTARGSVVLASDASHLYANMDQGRPFPIVHSVGDMLEGWNTVRALADSPDHVIPGHDPAVMQKYPAAGPGLDGVAVRLDVPPR